MAVWLDYMIVAGQYIFSLVALLMIFSLLPSRESKLYKRIWGWQKLEPSDRLLRVLRLDRDALMYSERAVLLANCGLEWSVLTYAVSRRLLLALFIVVLLILSFGISLGFWHASLLVINLIIISLLSFAALLWDQYWLKLYRELRAVAITREIYAISHQLLYFEDSSLHIHSKLRRCLPYSRLLRRDMETLLAEWYQDPVSALQGFKQRIGTAEGISFVETIDALRHQQHEGFYELLRAHLRDYKERLELAKESRKETSSYVLFVLAGIPILYTFQVFLYPWVQEVNKLMSMLE
ncbi:hypothetical protein ACFP56_14710 [Paenibacillus septentrionalis]|uniref:Type II secretion system protein GspF domain-containing protein n=1 Tax=Paenibacillus septentrionalis TaxID=429342 RepID=A0ABW1V6N1_9BACL